MAKTDTGWRARRYNQRWHGYTERTLAITLRLMKMSLLLHLSERFHRLPRVSDVACGTGILLRHLLERVPDIEVYGLDASQKVLAQARQSLHRWPKTHLMLTFVGSGDLSDLPYQPGAFDLITCTNTLHYFPQPASMVAGFKRWLAAEDQLVLEDFARREAPFPWRTFEWLLRQADPDHVQAYSLGSAQALCT